LEQATGNQLEPRAIQAVQKNQLDILPLASILFRSTTLY